MGIIFGRFRKKTTTYEQLENLDTQIREIEEYGKSTEITQKKVAGCFMLLSVSIYVVTALIFYFYFFPPTVYETILYVIPLITAPLIILSVKRILTWWYNRKLKRNYNKLAMLNQQKKKILDNVMETETYKNAKKILEKFAPEEVAIRKSPQSNLNSTNLNTSLVASRIGNVGVRYRGLQSSGARASLGSVFNKVQLTGNSMKSGKSVGNFPVNSTPLRPINSDNMALSIGPNPAIGTPRVPMVRTILPRERSAFDKMVDYLVGDGPSNRYALICKQCSSHNGMALREEFEYLSFHCCYCNFFNPAKKQRPPAPKLGALRNPYVDSSESEKNYGSHSDTGTFSQNTRSQSSDEVAQLTLLRQESSNLLEATVSDPDNEHPKDDETSSESGDETSGEGSPPGELSIAPPGEQPTKKSEVAEIQSEIMPMEISDQEKESTEGNEKD
ncbi:hypothetical protein WA026_003056 [Henosepilachna vigintioctopunctata]|uniref:Endoplasmic reticulum junction formation protein lunapark n=1 Tax=Henosepilachna vigintioctopunctata TaxID=420089 RepID=A0AAW1TM41_9CUCU